MSDTKTDLKPTKLDIVYLTLLSILLVFLLSLSIYLQVNYVKERSGNDDTDIDNDVKEIDPNDASRTALASDDDPATTTTEIKMFEFEREKLAKTLPGTEKMMNAQSGFMLLPTNEDEFCRVIGINTINNQPASTPFDTSLPSHDIFAVYDGTFVYVSDDEELVVIAPDGSERLRLQSYHYLNTSREDRWFAFDYEHALVVTEDSVESPQHIAPVHEVIGRSFCNSNHHVLRIVRRERGGTLVALLETKSREYELPIDNVHCIGMDDNFVVATNKRGDVCVTKLSEPSDACTYKNVDGLHGCVKFITSCQATSDGIFMMVTHDNRCLLLDFRDAVTILLDIPWPSELCDIDDCMTVRYCVDTKEFVVVANAPHALLYATTDAQHPFTVHVIANSEELNFFHMFRGNQLTVYSQKKDHTLQVQNFQRKSIQFA